MVSLVTCIRDFSDIFMFFFSFWRVGQLYDWEKTLFTFILFGYGNNSHSTFHYQCHGLWDEDDPRVKKEAPCQSEEVRSQSESEDERKDEESEKESEPGSSLNSERRGSNQTLRSINFGTSIDSGHVQVPYSQQQQTYQRRKSSSGGSHISHPSLHSSARSKRGEGFFSLLAISCY